MIKSGISTDMKGMKNAVYSRYYYRVGVGGWDLGSRLEFEFHFCLFLAGSRHLCLETESPVVQIDLKFPTQLRLALNS